MLRGEADLALPELKPGLSSSSVVGVGRHGGNASVGEEHREPFGRQFSAYARHTIARLASQVRCDRHICVFGGRICLVGLRGFPVWRGVAAEDGGRS